MSKFKTAYDTTTGSSIITKSIEEAINESFIRGGGYSENLDLITSLKIIPAFISGTSGMEDRIPYFTHPLLVEISSGSNKGHQYLVSDIRPFVSKPHNAVYGGPSYLIKNGTEFNFTKMRAIMSLAWLLGNDAFIKSNLMFAGTVFASMISETVTKRFALDPRDQISLFIVAHVYYQSLFIDGNEFSENDIQLMAIHATKASKAPASMVLEIIDQINKAKLSSNGVAYLCDCIKLVLDNIRLDQFNPGVLITAVANSWYGLNSKEILAVSLEHVPTWVSICYVALVERTYKNSTIARIADRYGKNGLSGDYIKSIVQLSVSYQAPLERDTNRPVKSSESVSGDAVRSLFNEFEV